MATEGETHVEITPWADSDLLVTASWTQETANWVIAVTGDDAAQVSAMDSTKAKDLAQGLSEAVRVISTMRRP